MLLKHKIPKCEYKGTTLLKDDIFRELVKRITPYKIHTENKEFFDAVADTLVNYSPISINIIDYWNKDDISTIGLVIPDMKPDYKVILLDPFEFKEGPVIKTPYGKGFFSGVENGEEQGGHLWDKNQSILLYPETEPIKQLCPGETKERFYINSLIGVQDKLAMNFMFDYYNTTAKIKNDPIFRTNLQEKLETYDLPPVIFNNINTLFDETRTIAHRNFVEKKGTGLGLRYVGKTAFDSQIQGKYNIFQDYFMDVIELEPFHYEVQSTLFDDVFERYIKPLAHPIGMFYDYRTTCTSIIANKEDNCFIDLQYRLPSKSKTLSVICKCYDSIENGVPVIKCEDQYNEQVVGTYDGYDLDPEFSDDEGTGNIPKYYEQGYITDTNSEYFSAFYEKYTFENGNYLVLYKLKSEVGVFEKTIEYRRFLDGISYELVKKWENKYHCEIKGEGNLVRVSKIEENFDQKCNITLNGIFSFLAKDEVVQPDQPSDDGIYYGFMGTSHGGHLRKI